MCAAAHGWVGLGRIVYVASSEQLSAWLAELGVPAAAGPDPGHPRGRPRPAGRGPGPRSSPSEVRELHRRFHSRG